MKKKFVYLNVVYLNGLLVAIAFMMLSPFSSAGTLKRMQAQADSVNKAQSLWKILNGTNMEASDAVIVKMAELLMSNQAVDAAIMATKDVRSTFALGAIKQYATRIANREVDMSSPPSDFVLTLIVGTLLDIPVKDLFLKPIRYSTTAGANEVLVTKSISGFMQDFWFSDQDIVDAIENRRITDQGQLYISDSDFRVGLVSSLQYGKASFEGGTNRRVIKKLAEDFLCQPIEKLANTNLSDRWVGKDIPRDPGGDPLVYLNKCVGCHTGLDSLRGAFAGFDFESGILSWSPQVSEKLNNNPMSFPNGHTTIDHSWQHLGWLPVAKDEVSMSGNGPNGIVKLIVESKHFYTCIAKRAHQVLCPNQSIPKETIELVGSHWMNHQSLRKGFSEVAVNGCL